MTLDFRLYLSTQLTYPHIPTPSHAHPLPPTLTVQSLLLKRAADALETFYTFPRPLNQPGTITSGQLNHISPLYYPKSPAVFTPAILTPHAGFTQARINSGLTFSPDKHAGHTYHHHHQQHLHQHHQQVDGHKLDPGEGSSTSAVSRCSSNETVVVQNHQAAVAAGVPDPASSQGSYFTFPPPESMGEIKTEPMNHQGIPKPKPLTPGPQLYSAAVAMPFVQFAPMNSQYPAGYLNSGEVNGYTHLGTIGADGGNRNNNNSTIANGVSHSMAANFAPVHFIPPSPGFFVAPTGTTVFPFFLSLSLSLSLSHTHTHTHGDTHTHTHLPNFTCTHTKKLKL